MKIAYTETVASTPVAEESLGRFQHFPGGLRSNSSDSNPSFKIGAGRRWAGYTLYNDLLL